MGNFLNQLPAIVGVIVGVLGTLLATSLTDRARWQRDQSVRWDTRRFEAYMAYATVIKEIHTLTFRISAPRRRSQWQPIDHEEGLKLLAEANVRRWKVWEAVLLLGDEGTVTAARAWREAVHAEELLCSNDAIVETEWKSAVNTVDQARDRFYAAARESLGVRGGSVAQSSFLQGLG